MFMEKSNGANLAPAKYMHVMYKCRVSLVGVGGGCPKYMYLEMKINKYIKETIIFPQLKILNSNVLVNPNVII